MSKNSYKIPCAPDLRIDLTCSQINRERSQNGFAILGALTPRQLRCRGECPSALCWCPVDPPGLSEGSTRTSHILNRMSFAASIANELPNGFYLALVYLVISGNYLGNLFGCRVQQLFREEMWLKHLLGLFTAYFLIVLSTPPDGYSALQTAALTVVIYGWFFLTTKMHVKMWIPMILAALVAYVLYVYKKQALPTPTSSDAKEDATVTQQRDMVTNGQKAAVLFSVIVTMLGVVAYFGEKRLEYGEDFDTWTFWTGVPECRFATPPVSLSTSLMAAFGMRA
jgi:hypothetical protein